KHTPTQRFERAEQRFTITGDCDFALRREHRAVRVNDRGSELGAADVDSQRGCLRHSSAEYRDLPRTHPLDGALLAALAPVVTLERRSLTHARWPRLTAPAASTQCQICQSAARHNGVNALDRHVRHKSAASFTAPRHTK